MEWDDGGVAREGVYVERRDTSSRLNAWVERWTDTGTLPRLIQITLERPNRTNWSAIVALGRTPL